MSLNKMALVTAACAAVLLSGCISPTMYVDNTLPAADKQSVAAVAKPQPIQLLYEFRTRGNPNQGATEKTGERVSAVAKSSGIFSEVSPAPVPGGRRLVITIDNVPITSQSDAAARGFGTGLTFGLIGTMVTDGYVCDATLTVPGAEPVKMSYRHAVHTTIGNASGPPGIVGMKPVDAVNAMIDQLSWSVMRDVSRSGKL